MLPKAGIVLWGSLAIILKAMLSNLVKTILSVIKRKEYGSAIAKDSSYTPLSKAEVLGLLRSCEYDPGAKASYDVFAGGLLWEDELPHRERSDALKYAFLLRDVLAYRASLSLGEPRKELEESWNQLKAAVPGWPGFRDERIYGKAQRILKVCKYKEDKELREIDRIFKDGNLDL